MKPLSKQPSHLSSQCDWKNKNKILQKKEKKKKRKGPKDDKASSLVL